MRLILLLGLAFPLTAIAQISHPFGKYTISAFDNLPDSTVYSAMQQFVNANQPMSYVGAIQALDADFTCVVQICSGCAHDQRQFE